MEQERKQRRTVSITRREVAAAISAAGKEGTEPYELGDEKCPGLSIRVRARSATWALRGRLGQKQTTWTIAPVQPGDDPAEIRDRAGEARRMLKRGIDPAEWLKEQALGGGVVRHFDPERDGWTWEQARERFLDFVKAERAKATYADYQRTLRGPDVKWSGDMLVKDISKGHVQRLQDDIYARGARTQATHTLRIVKACLSWVAQRGGSGLEESPATTVKPLVLGKDTSEKHVPTPEAVGDLPWLLDVARVNPVSRLAAMLVLLTAQRRETIVSALKAGFEETADGAIWTIAPAHMKSKRQHVIPLPPLAWGIVKQAMAVGRSDSPWLFPQLRLRRAGDTGDGHMSGKELGEAMGVAGSPIRPHVCRRAFATHGERLLGFGKSDTKAILDHAEGLSGDVTAMHYALHDGTHFKWRLMKQWETWVLEQISARKPAQETLPKFLQM